VTGAGRAALLLLLGGVLVRLLWSGSYALFVQTRMFLPLVFAAVVLLALGVHQALTVDSARDGGRRRAGPAVGWLLMLPVLVLVAVDPGGLGAEAARQRAPLAALPPTGVYPLLPPTDPLPLRVVDFQDRARNDLERSLDGRRVELEGLVVNDDTVEDGFLLTRFVVSCCAADGIPVQVEVRGAPEALPDDTWVRVVGTWRPGGEPERPDGRPVRLDVESVVVEGEPPLSAYESPY
jgi:uncharacterized repeat protein (TIGR03943 family)